MKNEWFASWFDTPYYHILYKDRDYEEAERFIKNLVTHLKLPENSKILDLACGKGRHSVFLNKLGFEVLGVDLSENSITLAAESCSEGLSFGVHDMREVLPNVCFDAVFNLFTSFGYFDDTEDNLKVINSVREMLIPKGIFVIDFMNAAKVIKKLVPEEKKSVDDLDFNIRRRYDGQHIFKDIEFEDNGKQFHYTERVQALKFDDFKTMLVASDFEILCTFGDFDLTAFDQNESDRLIIVAQKK